MARERGEEKPGKRKLLKWLVILGAVAAAAAAVMRSMKKAPCIAVEPGERLMVRDEENISGLGYIMKALFEEFLKSPKKLAILDTLKLSVAIEPTEQPETAITMTFSNGYIVLEAGVVNPDIKIVCDLETLMLMARMPAGPAAIKFLQTPEGKSIVSKLKSGQMKLVGLPAHPLAMMKFSKFLAPGDD